MYNPQADTISEPLNKPVQAVKEPAKSKPVKEVKKAVLPKKETKRKK